MTKEKRVIEEMAETLKGSYDCIQKIDALYFLKGLYPSQNPSVWMKAYKLAYLA